jgi:hypothetical protein
MFSPSRAFVTSALLALATALAAGCDGVNVAGASSDDTPDARVTVVTAYGDASDAGATEASAAGDMVAAAPALSYQGSPLCNASRSTGCCYPDDPTNAQACAQAACQTTPDGGAPEAASGAGAYIEVSLGCHVTPAEPSPDTSPGSTSVSPVCLPGGQGVDGFPCKGPDDCAPAYECVGATTPTCQRYCCGGNDACVSLQFCDIQPTALSPATKVPVCMPMQPCTLLDNLSCPSGETCAVVRDDGSTSCVAIGEAVRGQSCETDHCASGLVCLGTPGTRSCYTLCHTSKTECSSPQKCQGGLPLFPDPDVGICQ